MFRDHMGRRRRRWRRSVSDKVTHRLVFGMERFGFEIDADAAGVEIRLHLAGSVGDHAGPAWQTVVDGGSAMTDAGRLVDAGPAVIEIVHHERPGRLDPER